MLTVKLVCDKSQERLQILKRLQSMRKKTRQHKHKDGAEIRPGQGTRGVDRNIYVVTRHGSCKYNVCKKHNIKCIDSKKISKSKYRARKGCLITILPAS